VSILWIEVRSIFA